MYSNKIIRNETMSNHFTLFDTYFIHRFCSENYLTPQLFKYVYIFITLDNYISYNKTLQQLHLLLLFSCIKLIKLNEYVPVFNVWC